MAMTTTKISLLITLLLGVLCQVSYGLIVQENIGVNTNTRSSLIIGNGDGLIRTTTFSNSNNNRQRRTRTQDSSSATSILYSSKSNDDTALYSFGAEVVPEGQRPVNEYLDMKQAPLFGWGTNEVGMKGLLTRLGIVYSVVFFAVGFPIAGATYTSDGFLLQKICAANVGTIGFMLLLLVRIYSGWGYIGSRLQNKIIEYEETGWYDGNFEKKTEAELKRDQFLFQSDVQPAVDRLKLVSLCAAGLWVASCVGLNTAEKLKPKFNDYDPRVLQAVIMDEKFANAAAAENINNRPTYCDSRYYRAIANGGQGCGD
mmetsp:Transcript_23293/g.25968  ORF Transcript_23293/g.25968 Transcript_23293/m.25968 type:complete len:314 (+) Transcript_23293:186-1127(+)